MSTTVASSADKTALRALVRGHYDVQALRIAFGNRLATHFRRGLGQEPGTSTDELSTEAQQLIEDLKAEYGLLAGAVADCPPSRWQAMMAPHHDVALARKQAAIAREEEALAGITPQQEEALTDKERTALKKRRVVLATDKLGVQQGLIPYIQQPYDLAMARHYRAIEEDEDDLRAAIATLVKDFPIWDWLEGVRGVGPLMAAVIIAELDPHRAPTASCFWSYCGLGVKSDGLGQSRRKEHLVVQTYKAKDGTEQEKMGLGFSPFAKTKLVGVLGPSFLRAGGHYKTIYDQVKHRYESHPRYGLVAQENGEKEAHKKHRHDMAIRYCVKMFLLDLWKEWRALEGLSVGESYAEAKLNMRPHRSA